MLSSFAEAEDVAKFLTIKEKNISRAQRVEEADPLLSLSIYLSPSKFKHYREVERLWDLLADFGGFNDIVAVIFGFLLSRYTTVMFEGKIVKGTKIEAKSKAKDYNSNHLRVIQRRL